MAIPGTVPRGPVTASLNYYKPPSDNALPFNYVATPPPSQPQRNYADATHPTLITDIRGTEDKYNLDVDAFQAVKSAPQSKEKAFVDDAEIERNYYPEVEKLLLDKVKGSESVYIFDHTIRRANPDAPRNPVLRVHIDQTTRSVEKRVRRYYSDDEASRLLKSSRYRIINVWRPLNTNPVESLPLAFASSSTLLDSDVVPIEHRYPEGYVGETAAIKYNAEQKWYYWSGMTGDERLLLECFDSAALKEGSAIGGRVPHSAFEDPRTRVDADGRESIEVRALVFGSY